MTIQEALLQGRKILDDAGIVEPRMTAEVLLMHAISHKTPVNRAWLFAHSTDELKELWWIHYGRYLHERVKGKPTQFITGHQEFYGRDFRVTPDVLIPRPETEHLVDAALMMGLQESPVAGPKQSVLDIGTGSGAIAVTISLQTRARVFATDISFPALRIASENARALGADVDFVNCDLGSSFSDETFDSVLSNPPYIPLSKASGLQREVREFEPSIALFGGEDGLAIYRRLISDSERLLKPGGWLAMEVGIETAEQVEEMLLKKWEGVLRLPDLAGLPRVLVARRRGGN